MSDPHDIDGVAVKDDHGFALLFDLWVDGQWVGSRRTVEQCEEHLSQICGRQVNATFGSPW